MNMMHKRESGENPERCRHCVRELLQSPLGNREGEAVLERSQENCLGVELWVCGTQNLILIAIYRNDTSVKRYFDTHIIVILFGGNVFMRKVQLQSLQLLFYKAGITEASCRRKSPAGPCPYT